MNKNYIAMGILGFLIIICVLAFLLITGIMHILSFREFEKAVHAPRETGDSGIMEEVIRDEGQE